MKRNTLLTCILDAIDDICYVSDPETYELLYINRAGRALFPGKDGGIGGKCYEVLQQLDKPCDFCTNSLISPGTKYCWERYHPHLKKHFALTDTMISVNGKMLRLEVTRNITEYKTIQQELQHRLFLEKSLVDCVECLVSGESIAESMHGLLSIVGKYYGADRAYIFEIHYDKEIVQNTYEWCRPGVSAEISNLQNVPLNAIWLWLKRFKEQGAFIISSLKTLSPDSMDYRILKAQGINSLMVAPLMSKNKIIGFLGVDDPSLHTDELRLLKAIPLFVQDELMKRRMLEKMEWLSFRDALTGLYNRNKYTVAVNEIMECPPQKLGIIYVDINGLKAANDTYGHEYGDRIISKVAAHIKASVQGDIYRVGGDEFVVLCPNVDESSLEEMIIILRERMADEDASISIGTSWNDHVPDAADLIRFADHRMYVEKQNYYKSQLGGRKIRMDDAARQLCAAIEAGDFQVFFQLQVDLQTGAVAGAEAMVGKVDESNSLVSPDKFIPIYELEGIIRHLDFYVLDITCASLNALAKAGLNFPIMLNLSPFTLQERGVVSDISKLCRSFGVNPSGLCFKMPGTAGGTDHTFLRGLVTEFQRNGFQAALSGVCYGSSNLAVLTSVHFNTVILDKSFVCTIGNNPRAEAFLVHALSLCRSLGSICSLAEGVETNVQAAFLKKAGCCLGQGGLFSKPVEAEKLQEFVPELERRLVAVVRD